MRLRKALAVALLLLLAGTLALADSFELDAARIRQTTEYLCNEIGIRETGTPAERASCDWLEEQLSALGFSQEGDSLHRVEFQGFKEKRSENLIALCNPGAEGPLFSIVAHYDSVPSSPGARDNAASVGILLEIARLLGNECPALPCEIRMVFLGSEENGYHGSRAYVENLSPEDRARHAGAFNMDISAASPEDAAQLCVNLLGGRDASGYYLEAFLLPEIGNSLSDAVQAVCGQALGGVFYYGESDHVSFHDAGLEAINLCWRRVESGMPVLPESYHKMHDTPEALDYQSAVTTGESVLKAIAHLCD